MAEKEFIKIEGRPVLYRLPTGAWGLLVGSRYYVFSPAEGHLSDMGRLTTEMLEEITGKGAPSKAGFSAAARAIRESSAKRQVSEVPKDG